MMPANSRKATLAVFEDQRQCPLRKIAKAVGKVCIYAGDNGFGAIAAVLAKADFAQQEVPQRVDTEKLGKLHRVDDIAQ